MAAIELRDAVDGDHVVDLHGSEVSVLLRQDALRERGENHRISLLERQTAPLAENFVRVCSRV